LLGGHLHGISPFEHVVLITTNALQDGGENVIVKINGKPVCQSNAVYGGKEATGKGGNAEGWQTIGEMTPCYGPIPVKKGDQMTLESTYDLEKHPAYVAI
jgi:hypothetical protein